MTDEEIVRTYSDNALAGIVRQLSKSGKWPSRRQTAEREIARRKQIQSPNK